MVTAARMSSRPSGVPIASAPPKRPSGENAPWTGDCPTSTSSTHTFRAVSTTLSVVPLAFATYSHFPPGLGRNPCG